MGTEGIQDRYVNPYTDFGFKLLFGTDMNKELLISFPVKMGEYMESLKNFRDWYSVMKTQPVKGREEGLAEGMEKGETKERIKNARNLKALGIPVEVIAQATGLSQKDIEML